MLAYGQEVLVIAIIVLSVASPVFAQVVPPSPALEQKKADLLELRNNFVLDHQDVVDGPSESELARAIEEAEAEAKMFRAVRDSSAASDQNNLTALREELQRRQNLTPKTDPELARIDESYKSGLRAVIAQAETENTKSLESLDAHLAVLEQDITTAQEAYDRYREVMAQIEAYDQELRQLGISPEPVTPQTGWSRRVQHNPHARPGGDR